MAQTTTFDLILLLIISEVTQQAMVGEDRPLVVVEDGRPMRERMAKARIDDGGILSAARALQGGDITIVPRR